MGALRFEVFGEPLVVERIGARWRAHRPSGDGKRVPVDFVIPDEVPEDELAAYLYDLFHERAQPGNGDVRRV